MRERPRCVPCNDNRQRQPRVPLPSSLSNHLQARQACPGRPPPPPSSDPPTCFFYLRSTVAGQELLARFVQHVLPRGFVKIRHYGLHSARHATTRLELARLRLQPDAGPRTRSEPTADGVEMLRRLAGIDLRLCPACHLPALVRVALPEPRGRAPPRAA